MTNLDSTLKLPIPQANFGHHCSLVVCQSTLRCTTAAHALRYYNGGLASSVLTLGGFRRLPIGWLLYKVHVV